MLNVLVLLGSATLTTSSPLKPPTVTSRPLPFGASVVPASELSSMPERNAAASGLLMSTFR